MSLKIARPLILIAAMTLLLAACSRLQFAAANVAASGKAAHRATDIAYGPESMQRLDVYSPGPQQGSAPVIVYVHGGGWTSGSKDLYRFVGETLAARGYVTVMAGYRLYPDVRFPTFVEDAAHAVAWTRAHAGEFGGDPQRIFLMGHSAGAHIVMLLALDAHYLHDAGIETSELGGVIGLSGPYDFLPFGSGFDHRVFDSGGDPVLTQPIHFVRADAPPVLLLYGSADRTVAPGNSEHLAAALSALGASVTLKRYEGKSHGDTVAAFSNLRSNPPPVLDDIDAFVTRANRYRDWGYWGFGL